MFPSPVQLWFSCGSVWLLFDVCGSVWFSYGLAWCGIVPLRFSLGSAWCGMILYGSAQVQLRFSFGSSIGGIICLWLRFGPAFHNGWHVGSLDSQWASRTQSSLQQQGPSLRQLGKVAEGTASMLNS